MTLRVRWLGRVPYREALAVQQALFDHGREQHLLLLEHDHVFTYGQHAELDTNLRCDPASVGADFVAVNRGDRPLPDRTSLVLTLGEAIASRVVFVTMPGIDLSSTELRQRAAAGKSLRYATPPAVEAYVRDKMVYRGE